MRLDQTRNRVVNVYHILVRDECVIGSYYLSMLPNIHYVLCISWAMINMFLLLTLNIEDSDSMRSENKDAYLIFLFLGGYY